MSLEKFLYKKVSLWILIFTIILSLLSIIWFGSLVLRSETASNIAKIPENFKKIIKGQTGTLEVFENRFQGERGFVTLMPSSKNKHLLLSRYDGDLKRSIVELVDLNTKETIHTWKPDINKINSFSKFNKDWPNLKKDNNLSRYQMYHPILLSNGELIIHGHLTPLTKIGLCSNMIWNIDYISHHSIEKDELNFWSPFTYIPASVNPGLDEKMGSIVRRFLDDGIMKFNSEGKILFKKSIIQIFLDNELEQIIFGPGEATYDPIHLNDIQPVLFDSQFFKKGDLFLSFRHLSMIVLYRPSENKIIWYKQFPWVHQHDVDVLNGHQISIYNNKRMTHNFDNSIKKYNNILIYDFKSKKVLNNYENLFKKFDIRAYREGLAEIQSDGAVFIEEGIYGRALQFDGNGNLVWKYINRAKNNKLYRLNWSRIIEDIDNELILKIKNSNCEKK